MTELLDMIGEIGVFMLVAQTVVHFAAGRQYEKYIKTITGVILLLLFIEPFSASRRDAAAYWREQMEAWELGVQDCLGGEKMPAQLSEPAETAMEQIEERIADRLNAAAGGDYRVTDVGIDLEETEEGSGGETIRSWAFRRVRVTVEPEEVANAEDDTAQRAIRIDRITVGGGIADDPASESGEKSAQEGALRECREIFARALGVDEEKVEVIWRGEGERAVKEAYGR